MQEIVLRCNMRLLSLVFFNFFVVNCQTVKVPDIAVYVELPASKQGYGITTVSKKEIIIPPEKWQEKKKRALYVFSKDWAELKRVIRLNCHTNKCEKATGALDGLFLAIDDALKKVNP